MKLIKVASPGRINLLGEHTDYNQGLVLPAAIDRTIVFTLSRNGNPSRCTLHSRGYGDPLVADLSDIRQGERSWENYLLGVLSELRELTDGLRGFDCHIESRLPAGSGISSSAALECGLAFGLNELFGLGLSRWDLVELCVRAEHRFVGTRCGIMDQFASLMGRPGHAMLLDCRSLAFDYVPLETGPYKLLLLNSNVSHDLAESAYNTRREECETGTGILRLQTGLEAPLRELPLERLKEFSSAMVPEVYNRCAYVIAENNRVRRAVAALGNNDMEALGHLLYETHYGLRDLFEVSCPELDFLVDFTEPLDKVLGSRLMGGGFGGCTLNIVHSEYLEAFIWEISSAYRSQFGLELSPMVALPGPGTSLLKPT
ncbi:galactokinase [Robiginitalea sp. SC105]|uniref:galactokinase n=1 Tax=Robiginitalea sp. SC105 TaxID=2762332 RepID=UPI00163B2525|nr:galactokinase [Robiginitalea sp. SC105]MBC2840254.1 galactokinase [Robiginitalea sp. SC105]